MHKALRVHETAPSATPEGRRHPYPHVNPPPQRNTTVASPKAREIVATRRSGPEYAEVPPMKERPAVGGRKPLNNHLEQEDFQLLESKSNWGSTEGPRTPELETRHHQRRSNERLDRAVGTPHRDRRPANRARKRQGGADARRSSTKVADSPSKAEGHSRTPAPDAEATLHYDRSK